MAKALVFEGCPACESRSFAGFGRTDVMPYMTGSLKGGAIGAGGVIIADMILPRVLPTLSPLVRSLITGGVVIGTAYLLKDRNPELASGLAIGGGGIVAYKIINSLLGRVIDRPKPVAGLHGDMGDEDKDEDYGFNDDVEDYGFNDDDDVEIEERPYGVLVPEELGYAQEEIIVE